MKRALQVSESIELGIILALSGGFMDAYSYLERGTVSIPCIGFCHWNRPGRCCSDKRNNPITLEADFRTV